MVKILRKLTIVLLLISLSFALFSCIGSSIFPYVVVDKNIKSIELINYSNSNAKEKHSFDLNDLAVLERLDSTENDNFSSEFQISFHTQIFRKQILFSHSGIGIRIIYEDNSFQIITRTAINDKKEYNYFLGLYDSNGIATSTMDAGNILDEHFEDTINKYFESFFNIEGI